ncbi:MAG: PEP-CTERM sorting domain-containing protein [Planctomycetota bacterium]|nr:PEP-CTERM sorting domain-containing protein [Planctomycetota bacterium]
MVTENKLNKLSKKFCAYSAAAGAAATAGLAGDAQAAPVIYDTEANPIQVHSSFNTLPNGQNQAAIDPTALSASATSATTTATAAGLLGHATGAADNAGITNGQLAGTVYFRYEIFAEPSAGWGKSGTQFGVMTGAGNGLYATEEGHSQRPAGEGGTYGFVEDDMIGDGDNLLTADSVSTDPLTTAYSMGPGAAVQADLDGFGAFATGSHYNVIGTDDRYLGFSLNNRNGFVKINFNAGQRNRFDILGWGLESDPFVPIPASLDFASGGGGGGGGGGAVPEPATLAMLAIGGAGLVALRRRRNK